MYSSRDDQLIDFFSADFSGFTCGGDFLVKDRDAWVAITREDFAQSKEPLRIELIDLSVQSLAETVAVATGFFHLHLPIEDLVLSRETARLILIFRQEAVGWKICHSSLSIPYTGKSFAIVILDLTIPCGMGGQEAASLLQIDPEVKMIVSSGYADDPIIVNYTDHGFKGVAKKPYSMNKLAGVLDQFIEKG